MPVQVDTKKVVVGTTLVLGSAAALYWLKRRKGKAPPSSASDPNIAASETSASTSVDSVPPLKKRSSEEVTSSPLRQRPSAKESMTSDLAMPEFGPNMSWSAEVEKTESALSACALGSPASQISPASLNSDNSAKSADSPFPPSDQHSEASLDSGRGGSTGPVGVSPPVDAGANPIEAPPIYEFEIPQHIVGLIIGKKGIVIKDLTAKSGTWILIRDHNWKDNFKICTIEGTREQINSCLRMIRRRFPPSRYPDLNLNPLLPPPIASPNSGMWGQMVQLQLPDGVGCEVVVSAMVDAGHVFVQQPTHPSFTSLTKLDGYMLAVYSQPNGIPALPQPVELGVICAAPTLGGWYRALTVESFESSNEVLVKFVDYGGYSRLPADDLKQIRSDFMSLPFQATECYLANVVPKELPATKGKKWATTTATATDGLGGWGEEAAACVEALLCNKVVEARVDHYAADSIPCVKFFTTIEAPDGESVSTEIGAVLVEEGHAKWAPENSSPDHRPLPNPSFRQTAKA